MRCKDNVAKCDYYPYIQHYLSDNPIDFGRRISSTLDLFYYFLLLYLCICYFLHKQQWQLHRFQTMPLSLWPLLSIKRRVLHLCKNNDSTCISNNPISFRYICCWCTQHWQCICCSIAIGREIQYYKCDKKNRTLSQGGQNRSNANRRGKYLWKSIGWTLQVRPHLLFWFF